MASFFVTGWARVEWSQVIEADSQEEARAKVQKEIEGKDGWVPDADHCDDAGIYNVTKVRGV